MPAVVEKAIFRPKYDWKLWAGFPFFGLTIPICAVEVWSDPLANPMLSFCTVMMTAIMGTVGLILIRRIRFQDEAFVVEYYVRRPQRIAYGAVQDIGGTAIKTRSGNIGLMSMNNAGELLGLLWPQIKDDQLSGKMLESESYVPHTVTAGMLLWPALFFLHSWLGVPAKWIELLTFGTWMMAVMVVYYAVRWYYRARYERHK